MKKFNRSKKMSKASLVGLALVIVGMVAVTGALITFYLNADTQTGTIDDLLEYSVDDTNWNTMEDYTPTISFSNIAPGDSETITRYVQISSNINEDHTIKFTLKQDTGCTSDFEGVVLTLFDNSTGTPVEVATCTNGTEDSGTIVFSAGEKVSFLLTLEVDNYYDTEEGTEALTYDFLVERNAVMP